MNERIHDLAMLARKHFPKTETSGEFWVLDEEKFAELIVRECIGCCEQVISDPVPESVDTWLNGGEQCIVEIKQHFGVEEC
jgi:hypothetical protein